MKKTVKKAINTQADTEMLALASHALRRKRNKTGGDGLLTANELNGLML